jgi:hypothetical protein
MRSSDLKAPQRALSRSSARTMAKFIPLANAYRSSAGQPTGGLTNKPIR